MPEKQQVGGLTEKWALSLVQVLGPNSVEYVLYLSFTRGLFHCSGSLGFEGKLQNKERMSSDWETATCM